MRMTISVPDELGEQIRELGLPISSICQKGLRTAVENATADNELIKVETGEDYNITKGFMGRWLVEPDSDGTRADDESWDAGAYWGVAATQKGRIAVYTAHCNEGFPGQLEDFDALEDAHDQLPENIYAQAAAALGEDYVIMLDI